MKVAQLSTILFVLVASSAPYFSYGDDCDCDRDSDDDGSRRLGGLGQGQGSLARALGFRDHDCGCINDSQKLRVRSDGVCIGVKDIDCVDPNEELVWRLCTSRNAPEFRLTNDHALKFKAWTSNYYDANPDDYHYNDHHLDDHGDHEHIKYTHDLDHQHDDCDKDCDTEDHQKKWHGSRQLEDDSEAGMRKKHKHDDDDDDDDDDDHMKKKKKKKPKRCRVKKVNFCVAVRYDEYEYTRKESKWDVVAAKCISAQDVIDAFEVFLAKAIDLFEAVERLTTLVEGTPEYIALEEQIEILFTQTEFLYFTAVLLDIDKIYQEWYISPVYGVKDSWRFYADPFALFPNETDYQWLSLVQTKEDDAYESVSSQSKSSSYLESISNSEDIDKADDKKIKKRLDSWEDAFTDINSLFKKDNGWLYDPSRLKEPFHHAHHHHDHPHEHVFQPQWIVGMSKDKAIELASKKLGDPEGVGAQVFTNLDCQDFSHGKHIPYEADHTHKKKKKKKKKAHDDDDDDDDDDDV